MAGAPVRQRVLAALRARAAELGEDATPLDYVCAFIGSGGRVIDLARQVGGDIGFSVSRSFVSGVIHGLAEDASARIEAARRQSAGALAEEAAEIADKAEPMPGAVAKAGLQVKTRQWLAERFDPERYGSRVPGIAVQVNVGELFLDALRQPIDKLRARVPPVESRLAFPAATDAEVSEQNSP